MPQVHYKSPVRFGLVGLGDWGHQVALAAELDPGVTLAARYARSRETRMSFAQRYVCTPCSSYEKMLGDSTVEALRQYQVNSTSGVDTAIVCQLTCSRAFHELDIDD